MAKRAKKELAKARPAKAKGQNSYIIASVVVIALVFFGALAYYANQKPQGPSPEFTQKTGTVELPPKAEIKLEPWTEPQTWAFKDAYLAVRYLDLKYETAGADFHKENLRHGFYVRANAADDYMSDLDALTKKIGSNTVPEQNKSIQYFLSARKKMIASEKAFQQAMSYGLHGVFTKEMNCEDRDIIVTASKLYNTSNVNGWRAMADLDRALASYDNAREYIGVNTPTQKNRPAFYDNIFVDLGYLVNSNYERLNDYCDGYKVKDPNIRGRIAEGNLSFLANQSAPKPA